MEPTRERNRDNARLPRYLLAALLLFAAVSAVGIYLSHVLSDYRAREQQVALTNLATLEGAEIERSLNHLLSATFVLAQVIRYRDGEIIDFERLSSSILANLPGIANLQLAPNGIIEHVYPLAGNEAIIGHDVLNDDARRNEALQAVLKRELTLAGPFTLKQGGVGMVGRYPVFVGADQGQFWGFASALIMLDDLLERAGIKTVDPRLYFVEIGRVLPDSSESIFYSSHEVLPESLQTISIPVEVPGGNWFVRMGVRSHGANLLMLSGSIVSLLLGMVVAILAFRILNEPEQLRVRVAEQTRDLERMVYIDQLTEIPNRFCVARDLEHAIQQSRRTLSPLHVLIVDIDLFKDVNDVMGHETGDKLLVAIAQRLRASTPKRADVGRLGADEFIVWIANENSDSVSALAEKLLIDLNREFCIEDHQINVTASIGIVALSEDVENATELLKRAAQAVGISKSGARNSCSFYSAKMHEESKYRKRLAYDMQRAVENNELQLLYQPMVCADDNSIPKAEALLRWQHPELGIISPLDFIPIAEETGLIIDLGRWVLEEAQRQTGHWRNDLGRDVQVSVNVSPVQLRSDNHVQEILEYTQSPDNSKRNILIEITEGILLENTSRVQDIIQNLNDAGMEIAVDDFGTGYSSLSYLKNFALDYLKIDRSFVSNMAEGNEDLALCEGIILIAQKLGLRVVAEGVETADQHHLLVDAGVDYLQGYLYSRPVAGNEFDQLLVNGDLDLRRAA